MKIIILYVMIGLVVGSVSGALGIGGGVLLVPALVWLCRFEPAKAAGTSLAILIPPIGLPAAMKAFHEKRVQRTQPHSQRRYVINSVLQINRGQ